MFYILVNLKVKNDKDTELVGNLLKEISTTTLNEEPCCKRFEIYHSLADPNLFVLCEHWESKTEWELHREKRAFSEIYLPKVIPLVEREPHISELISANE